MILTCPNCATDFFVEDHLIGAGGRRVKCDECGEIWTASPATLPPEPEAVVPAAPEPVAQVAPAVAAPEPAGGGDAPMFAPLRPPPPRPAPFPWRRLLIGFLAVLVAVTLIFAFQLNHARISSAADAAYRDLGLAHIDSKLPHG